MPSSDLQAPAGSTPSPASQQERAGVRLGFIAAGVVVVCWSGFNIVSRLGGRSPLTPYDVAALRFGVSALLLLPLFLPTVGDPALTLPRRLALACSGGLGYGLLVYVGFSLAPAAHAGVLVNGGIPLFTTLIGWLVFRQHPTRRSWLALVIAAFGMLMIGRHAFRLGDGSQVLLGDACFLAGATLWGLFGQLVRRWQINPRAVAANTAVCSSLLYLPVYLLWLPKGFAAATGGQILLQAVYQGVVAGIVAATCYSFATLRIGPTRASLMLALVPPISAVLAVPFLGEALTVETVLGALLVTTGAVVGATGGHGVRR
ncbi:MAG: DMT family transporter [Pseudomonadota bacterium]|nr:DMT family transporter [Pseudomonadota bacterium]